MPYEENKGVVICPYCGSQNTIGKSAESQSGLVNRANYLRRNNEFDKAAAVYEELLKNDNTDYEAHWGLVLCKFGIEYVDDPASGERKPTCHRTYADSVFADSAYRAALEYAPLDVKEVYEKEAAQIDRIQKDIIALSQREEKYDVFLCYKELDESGNRTQDSVIAQELEFELSRRGYKVFFARKTLEKVLGSAYEPIIYAALQSARAMVVIGTKQEHFQAVWVRNEWSRYRELIRHGAQKILIPAYRGMSPYDLPMELSNLQSLDMAKLGFVQDLCDGIDRFVRAAGRAAEPFAAAPAQPGGAGVDSLINRAMLFIQEGSLEKANEYIERALDQDPEEPRAYVARFLMDCGVKRESEIAGLTPPIKRTQNLINAEVFGGDAVRDRLEGYITEAEENAHRREQAQRTAFQAFDDLKRKTPKGILMAIMGTIFGVVATYVVIGLIFVVCEYGDEVWMLLMFVFCFAVPSFILMGCGYARRRDYRCVKKCRSAIWPGDTISQIASAIRKPEKVLRKMLVKWMRRGLFQSVYIKDDKLIFRFQEAEDSAEGLCAQTQEERAVIEACVNKMPRGTLFYVLGGVAAAGMLVWQAPALWGYVEYILDYYIDLQFFVALMHLGAVLLPMIVLFSVGKSFLKRRKLFILLSPRIISGATVAKLAGQTCYTEKKITKLLSRVIRRGWLQGVRLTDGTLLFANDEPGGEEQLNAES